MDAAITLFKSVFENIIAGIIVAGLALLIFDIEKLKFRLAKIFGIKIYKTFERINTRMQVVTTFNQLFVSYQVKNGGKIYLMSNTGGYPEFDPYVRILELTSSYDSVEIYIAVTIPTFQEYAKIKPDIIRKLLTLTNVKLYLFKNLIPYKFRIGINTDLESGFFCTYHGHLDNKVTLEGIKSKNPLFLEAFENLYLQLLNHGVKLSLNNWESILEIKN